MATRAASEWTGYAREAVAYDCERSAELARELGGVGGRLELRTMVGFRYNEGRPGPGMTQCDGALDPAEGSVEMHLSSGDGDLTMDAVFTFEVAEALRAVRLTGARAFQCSSADGSVRFSLVDFGYGGRGGEGEERRRLSRHGAVDGDGAGGGVPGYGERWDLRAEAVRALEAVVRRNYGACWALLL